MNNIDYKELYDRAGKEFGWDFSHLKTEQIGKKWDFYQEVVKRSGISSILLDLGTGGGEKVLEVSDKFLLVVATDISKSMISRAQKNLKKLRKRNVKFLVMDSFKIEFPDNFFDIVSCKHSDFSIQEVYRVLKKGGYLLTQDVSEADKINIKETFGRGQEYGIKDGTLQKKYIKELKKTGFHNIKADDYNAEIYYKRDEDLIFLLKNTPIIHDFGSKANDLETLKKFISKNKTPRGIKTNAKRFMITARK